MRRERTYERSYNCIYMGLWMWMAMDTVRQYFTVLSVTHMLLADMIRFNHTMDSGRHSHRTCVFLSSPSVVVKGTLGNPSIVSEIWQSR